MLCLGIMKDFFLLFIYIVIVQWASASNIGCNTHATILRQLEREGFHLDVHSFVELIVDVETVSKWENCSVALRENISDSFYVNPDQLSELNRTGISNACTVDKVDTEAPQHLSQPHTVYVYNQLLRSQNLIYSHLNFPLHFRYHKPSPHGKYAVAELKSPVLLIRCPGIDCKNLLKSKAPCSDCGSELCTWTRFPYKTNSQNLTLPVPVGNLNHLWFVSPITYLLTYGGCAYVLFTIISTGKM